MSKHAVLSLLHFGEIELEAPWADYLEHGITSQDIPALLDMLTDPGLHKAAVDSSEIWAPQHAWRALGQLADESAINGLVTSLNTLVEDDTAHQELPDVMAMIGPAAQPALGEFLLDNSNQEFARAIAAQALQNIAEQTPESRASTVKLLSQHCSLMDPLTPDLNALVVCSLIDLKAIEAIDIIRQLYEKEIVDLYAVGDIEDVEIALGLRKLRDTPRPDYGMVHSLNQGSQPVIHEQHPNQLFDELQCFLDKYHNKKSINDLSELDGFLCAIICAPNTIIPSRWICSLWGGEASLPNFPDESSSHLFTSAVMAFYNQIIRALRSKTYSPLFSDHPQSDDTLQVEAWCSGFMRGFGLWHEVAGSERSLLEQWLHPIKLFGTEQGIIEQQQQDQATLNQQRQLIDHHSRELFEHFVIQRGANQVAPSQLTKVGRNDPCPCGSGKKFKKCCLH